MLAHRWAYQNLVAAIPDGMEPDHLCRNPLCVNPLHIEIVTKRENILRGFGAPAVNARKVYCLRGHKLEGWTVAYFTANGRIYRRCRMCVRVRAAKNKPTKQKKET